MKFTLSEICGELMSSTLCQVSCCGTLHMWLSLKIKKKERKKNQSQTGCCWSHRGILWLDIGHIFLAPRTSCPMAEKSISAASLFSNCMLHSVPSTQRFFLFIHENLSQQLYWKLWGSCNIYFLLMGKIAKIQQVTAIVHLIWLESEQVLKGDS